MSNLAAPLDLAARRFVEDFAALQAPWGMTHATGRLYGLLLLSEAPLGACELAAMLDMARSSVSVAARMLERAGLVRRHGESGTKRVRYAPAEDAAGLLAGKAALLGSLANLLRDAAESRPPAARSRLNRHAAFYSAMRVSIDLRLRDFECDRTAA